MSRFLTQSRAWAEKTLRDNADKIEAGLKTDVEEKVKAVREAIAADDKGRIESTLEALSLSMQKIGEAVYGAASAGAPSGDGTDAGTGAAEEGTVEGEFREV